MKKVRVTYDDNNEDHEDAEFDPFIFWKDRLYFCGSEHRIWSNKKLIDAELKTFVEDIA